ncbi:MAG: hypothetical protein AAF799_44055 [Myxococcota bacterium]
MNAPRPSPLLVRALLVTCVGFAGVGLLLTIAGRTELFSPWRTAAAQALLGRDALPPSVLPLAALTDGILGGTVVGKWVAAAWLVAVPLRQGQRWAWWALLAGQLGCFVVGSGVSVTLGAHFNVWMVDAAPLVLLGGLLVACHRSTSTTAPPTPAPNRAWLFTQRACIVFVVVGVVVATTSHTVIFELYRHAIADTWFRGQLPADALAWVRMSYALVGATFVGHFIMLAMALHYAAGQRWVLQATVSSMLAWFFIDSIADLVHGAWFNVWMINLPSLSAVLIPAVLAYRHIAASSQGHGVD